MGLLDLCAVMQKFEDAWAQMLPEVRDRIQKAGGVKALAELIEVSPTTLYEWLKGGQPKLFGAVDLLTKLGYGDFANTLTSSILGRSQTLSDEFHSVPVYDVELAAGAGSLNDSLQLLYEMPMPLDLLQSISTGSIDKLGLFPSRGDSMIPTINDGSLVLVDMGDQRVGDGVFAFIQDGEARLKRFARTYTGVTLISDNEDIYKPEHLNADATEALQIIGRVRFQIGRL